MLSSDGSQSADNIPQSLKLYERWLGVTFRYQEGPRRFDYEAIRDKLSGSFRRSYFWTLFTTKLRELHYDYRTVTGVDLFAPLEEPKLHDKSFESFLEKTYRLNFPTDRHGVRVRAEKLRPPEDLYDEINDIVRTIVVVKYLDGVDRVIEFLRQLCSELHIIDYYFYYKSGEDGYYAAHFYIPHAVDVHSTVKRRKIRLHLPVEIQITTQLQEAIRKFLHDLYASTRSFRPREGKPWQWRYEDDEFFANYVGHILHNMEGMIMEVRRRQEARHAKI